MMIFTNKIEIYIITKTIYISITLESKNYILHDNLDRTPKRRSDTNARLEPQDVEILHKCNNNLLFCNMTGSSAACHKFV